MGRATQIRQIVDDSRLRECVILNAYSGVNQIRDKRLATWGMFSHEKNKSSAVGSDTIGNKSLYAMTGRSLARQAAESLWAGNCQTYACTSAALLAKSLAITSIELFSFGTSFSGHVFLVIDRDQTGEADDLAQWGPRAIVVDVWYSNQRAEDPDGGVYKIVKASEYKTWLTLQAPFKLLLAIK